MSPTPTPADLTRAGLTAPAVHVAPRLLDHVLVHDSPDGPVAVRLTEVEAYSGADDPGSHAFRGRTARNAVMFGEAGHLYVYFTYGMHWCANVVCGPEGQAAAVLLRAGEVVDGVELARRRRQRPDRAVRDVDLARGPARLTRALGLDGSHNGIDLYAPRTGCRLLTRTGASVGAGAIRQDVWRSGPRVGVSGPGGDPQTYAWRFWLDGEPTVSPYRPGGRPRVRANASGRRGVPNRGRAG
jgi:DNA-3-methyladenine glycosylase